MENINHQEVEKFSKLANEWWNMDGELKTLHQINPLRLSFIQKFCSIKDKTVLDIGCGGGILAESLAKNNAITSALDASAEAIVVAKNHAEKSNLKINYYNCTIEDFAQSNDKTFDIVTCMEMLEHVPSPESIIKEAAKLVKSGGYFFASTLNRNMKSYLLSIVAAEYILKMVPKGTHEYSKFIKPYELIKEAEKNGLKAVEMIGIHYNPIIKSFKLGKNSDVNYIIAFKKV